MTVEPTLVTGLAAASLALAGGLAVTLAQYNLAAAKTETRTHYGCSLLHLSPQGRCEPTPDSIGGSEAVGARRVSEAESVVIMPDCCFVIPSNGIADAEPHDRPAASYRTIATLDPRLQATAAEPPLVVSIPHRLRKQEALRRVKSGLESIRQNYGFLFNVQEEIWTGYHLLFRVSMLGRAGNGSIDVTDHAVRLELFLPWPLSKLAEAALPAIRREGALMLERK